MSPHPAPPFAVSVGFQGTQKLRSEIPRAKRLKTKAQEWWRRGKSKRLDSLTLPKLLTLPLAKSSQPSPKAEVRYAAAIQDECTDHPAVMLNRYCGLAVDITTMRKMRTTIQMKMMKSRNFAGSGKARNMPYLRIARVPRLGGGFLTESFRSLPLVARSGTRHLRRSGHCFVSRRKTASQSIRLG